MSRILVSEELAESGLSKLRAAGHEVDVQVGLTPEQLQVAIKGAHALIVRSATQVDDALLAAADDLVVVGRAGVGLADVADDLDEAGAERRAVVVRRDDGRQGVGRALVNQLEQDGASALGRLLLAEVVDEQQFVLAPLVDDAVPRAAGVALGQLELDVPHAQVRDLGQGVEHGLNGTAQRSAKGGPAQLSPVR